MALHACLTAMALCLGAGSTLATLDHTASPAAPAAQAQSPVTTNSSAKDAPRPLQPGDEPPALSVDKWIKGGPIERFEKGKVYVVEFWATWCKPCLEGIPRLSQLQRQYRSRGLVAIGVASHEFRGLKTLSRFVKQRGKEMGYAIAFDGDDSMETAWQTRGIPGRGFKMPEVYVIDADGKIAWVGHPNSQKGEKLAEVIAELLGPPEQDQPADTRTQTKP